jgi:hypothetical protein
MLAAKVADIEMMRLLQSRGADPRVPNVEGTTPLMVAAGVGLTNKAEDAGTDTERLEAVKLLLEWGADVNAIDKNGETALHGAAYTGCRPCITVLVDRGARLDVKNVLGWTPLTIADGVFYTDAFKAEPETAELLRGVMREHGLKVEDRRLVNDTSLVSLKPGQAPTDGAPGDARPNEPGSPAPPQR